LNPATLSTAAVTDGRRIRYAGRGQLAAHRRRCLPNNQACQRQPRERFRSRGGAILRPARQGSDSSRPASTVERRRPDVNQQVRALNAGHVRRAAVIATLTARELQPHSRGSSRPNLCHSNCADMKSRTRARRYAPNARPSTPISPAPALPILEQQDSPHSRRDRQSIATSVSNYSSRSSMDIGNLLSPLLPSDPVGQAELAGHSPHNRPRYGMALPCHILREASNVSQHKVPGLSLERVQHQLSMPSIGTFPCLKSCLA
jgi:hypothetical protein